MIEDATTPNFAEVLREHRQRAGLSQEQLAERAGLSAKAIGALEQGRRRAPYRDTVAALGSALGLSPHEINVFELSAARARLKSGAEDARQPRNLRSDNLPAPVTSFVGREREIDDISRLLKHHRLITVTGSGGLGKTRLALESSSRQKSSFAHGIWFVELASISDGRAVVSRMAAAIGITLAAGEQANNLANQIGEREMLLVIDNCEHVLEHVVGIVAMILRECPRAVLLATSREHLALSGEVTYRIPALPVPPDRPGLTTEEARQHAAVQLFIDRAEMADPRFVFSEARVAAVAQICRKVEGIPLAVEIAAARLPYFGLASLRQIVEQRLNLMTNASVDSPSRQKTLHAMLEWSYELLDDLEKRLLRSLSVLPGGCTLDSARALWEDSSPDSSTVPNLLTSLVEKSLLNVQELADGVRYVLLDSTRAFAAEKLKESGDEAVVLTRLADWAADYADAFRHSLYRMTVSDSYQNLFAEIDNLYAAFHVANERAEAVAAGRIFVSLQAHWQNVDRQEALDVSTRLIGRLNSGEHPVTAAALLIEKAGLFTGFERLNLILEARDLLTRTRDAHALMICYMRLSWAYLIVGRPSKASDALGYTWKFAVLDGIDNLFLRTRMLWLRGGILESLGNLSEAKELYAAAAVAAKSSRNFITEAFMLLSYAEMTFCGGEVLRAQSLFEEIIDDDSWDAELQTYVRLRVAACLCFLGDLDAAQSLAEAAIPAAKGDVALTVKAIAQLAHVKSLRGDSVAAAQLAGYVERRVVKDGTQRDAFDRLCHESLMQDLATRLSPEETRRYFDDAELMDLDRAISIALA